DAPLPPANAVAPRRIAQVAFEVDPVSGSVQEATGTLDNAQLYLSPISTEHVRVVNVTCAGCNDSDLYNQVIKVRFTVGDFILHGVMFEREDQWSDIGPMECGNCYVGNAVLGTEWEPLPPLGPGDVFEAVLNVYA